MADITVSGNVTPDSIRNVDIGITQVAITAGQVVYKDASNGNKLNLADADAEASAVAEGIALADADAGAACPYLVTGGQLTISGAPFTKGTDYYVSTTAGGIAPKADLGAGDYVTRLGTASSTSVLLLEIDATGVTI